MKNEQDLKIMQFFLPHYKRFYIKSKDINGDLILSCKDLNDDGSCRIYDKRPLKCKNYPAKTICYNAQMPDKCGFKIIKKEFKDYL